MVVVPKPELLKERVGGSSERGGRAARGGVEQEGEGVGVWAELRAEHAEEQAKGGARAREGKEAERDVVGEGGGGRVGGEEEEGIVGGGSGGGGAEGEELGEEVVVGKGAVGV